MSESPTVREWFAYWTLIPLVVISLVLIISPLPLWLFGIIPYTAAFAVPWITLAIACAWVTLFGEAVMPATTYRNRYR